MMLNPYLQANHSSSISGGSNKNGSNEKKKRTIAMTTVQIQAWVFKVNGVWDQSKSVSRKAPHSYKKYKRQKSFFI